VWRLQRGNDAESQFFQRSVNGGELITDEGTRQGIWVIAPSGKLLSHVNSNQPERVLAMLRQGLAAWDGLDAEQRRLPQDARLTPEHRWEHSYPVDGLVLERIARDLPHEGRSPAALERWNRDFVWFSAQEARRWLPEKIEVGAQHVLPADLALRLARFHLVDNVRGQTLPYAEQEVAVAEIRCRVLAVADGRARVEFSGRTCAAADGPWLQGQSLWTPKQTHPHGIETRLLGHASFDFDASAFEAFELLGLGWRTGRTVMNGRGRDASPGPIGFHLQLAPPGLRVAPTFVAVYGADWIELPDDPRQLCSD